MERRKEQSTANCFGDACLRVAPSTASNQIDPLTVFNTVLHSIVRMDFHKRFRFLTDQLRYLACPSTGVPLALDPSRRQNRVGTPHLHPHRVADRPAF